MKRDPLNVGRHFYIAVGALLLAGAQPTDRKYTARDYFAEPKVAELAAAAREGDVERVDQLIWV